jgi:hypothetical protein
MLSFLEKYNQLPYDVKERMSSPEVMRIISELESKFGVNLAIAVMRVMVKEIALADLAKFFVFEYELNAVRAEELAAELKAKLFIGAADHLGLTAESAPKDSAGPAAAGSALAAQKSASSPRGAGAGFFFSSEDEEEVKAYSMKVAGFQGGKGAAEDYDGMIEAVLSRVNMSLSSAELNNRLKQVLRTYLRGVRSRLDAKQTLLKPVTEGGLGLDLNAAERLVFTADEEKKAGTSAKPMPAPPKIRLPEDVLADKLNKNGSVSKAGSDAAGTAPAGLARDIPYDFSRFKTVPRPAVSVASQPAAAAEGGSAEAEPLKKVAVAVAEKEADPGNAGLKIPLAAVTGKYQGGAAPVMRSPAGQAFNGAPVILGKAGEQAVMPEPSVAPAVRRPVYTVSPTATTGKVRMEDVKYVPKLTGPVDELREMDFVNFRRLSHDPLSAIAKIKEKISSLENEDYSQRLAGIKAWRESPVNKLYLAIGQESISQGRSVGEIIKARIAAGQDFLSEQEFLSIMDLNKSLRF